MQQVSGVWECGGGFGRENIVMFILHGENVITGRT